MISFFAIAKHLLDYLYRSTKLIRSATGKARTIPIIVRKTICLPLFLSLMVSVYHPLCPINRGQFPFPDIFCFVPSLYKTAGNNTDSYPQKAGCYFSKYRKIDNKTFFNSSAADYTFHFPYGILKSSKNRKGAQSYGRTTPQKT